MALRTLQQPWLNHQSSTEIDARRVFCRLPSGQKFNLKFKISGFLMYTFTILNLLLVLVDFSNMVIHIEPKSVNFI